MNSPEDIARLNHEAARREADHLTEQVRIYENILHIQPADLTTRPLDWVRRRGESLRRAAAQQPGLAESWAHCAEPVTLGEYAASKGA